MIARRRAVLPLTLALLLAGASIANAATTYTDTIVGIEYAATPTVGSFVGLADGDLPGVFNAQVVHTVLTQTATITGGTFVLLTSIADVPTTISGTFAGGTVTQTDKNTHPCRDQHYVVSGTLANVGVGGAGGGTGTFNATLTHHRTRIEGQCVTFFATLTGSVSLTF
ncbi:MAG TPA: hypothetical protein VFM93_05315 [Candidatus Limnocylindria bacterium]|nr:hypothetical protein [Candidatus Limnocylindria bacterium]